MTELNIVTLGASKLVNGVPVVQAVSALTNGTEDVETYGEIETISQLGVSACPAEADDKGHVDGVICEQVGGANAVCVGAIDRRNAAIYGSLGPGDTCVHATGPNAVAQCLLKAKKRQAILATKDKSDKQMLVILDGKNETIQITAFGALLQLSKADGWTCLDETGKGWRLSGGTLHLTADVHIGGPIPLPFKVMLGPPTGSPGGAASVPMTAAMGLSFGA